MPLRDISPYHEWIKLEAPSQAARRVARTFIVEMGDEPWRAPSVPIAELSNQPEYELRTVALPAPVEDEVHVLLQVGDQWVRDVWMSARRARANEDFPEACPQWRRKRSSRGQPHGSSSACSSNTGRVAGVGA